MANPTTGRFHQLIRRLFSLKESYDADVPETFMPVMNLVHTIEYDKLRLSEVHLISGGLSQAAPGVGNFNQWVLQAQPNQILVVNAIAPQNDAFLTSIFRVTWAFAAFGGGLGVTQAVHADGRAHDPKGLAGPATPSAFFSAGATAVLPVGPFLLRHVTSASAWFDVFWVLYGGMADPKTPVTSVPSWRILITEEQANQQGNVSFRGFIRYIEPSEQY